MIGLGSDKKKLRSVLSAVDLAKAKTVGFCNVLWKWSFTVSTEFSILATKANGNEDIRGGIWPLGIDLRLLRTRQGLLCSLNGYFPILDAWVTKTEMFSD